jgi:hypothetical protein
MQVHLIPLPTQVHKKAARDKDYIVADLGNSKVSGKQAISYFTNLQVPFEFAPCDDKAKKFEAFKEFITNKFKTPSVQLIETLIRALSIYHGKDLGEGPNFLTVEEIEEFIATNKELFDSIVEYFNAMPYTMMTMIDQYKTHFIEPLIESGNLVAKKDDHIGVNVIKLAGLPGFIEEYLTWVEGPLSNVCFTHSMKAGEHVHKLIMERPENSSVALLYALANQKFTEADPTQEA